MSKLREYWHIIALFILLGCLVGSLPLVGILYLVAADNFENELKTKGITVEVGVVDSPSLVKPLNKTAFFTKISDLDTTVYRYGTMFYIFEPTMLIAYSYRPPFLGIW